MKLRNSTSADTLAVRRVFFDAWYPLCHSLGLDPELIHPDQLKIEASILVEDDGVILGFAHLQDEMLNKLYVSPLAQGRGVGKLLMEEVISRGAKRLLVDEHNEKAIGFYLKNGWGKSGMIIPGTNFPNSLLLEMILEEESS